MNDIFFMKLISTQIQKIFLKIVRKKWIKQAGAELCQAQTQVELPAVAEFIFTAHSTGESKFCVFLAISNCLVYFLLMSFYIFSKFPKY